MPEVVKVAESDPVILEWSEGGEVENFLNLDFFSITTDGVRGSEMNKYG